MQDSTVVLALFPSQKKSLSEITPPLALQKVIEAWNLYYWLECTCLCLIECFLINMFFLYKLNRLTWVVQFRTMVGLLNQLTTKIPQNLRYWESGVLNLTKLNRWKRNTLSQANLTSRLEVAFVRKEYRVLLFHYLFFILL